MSDVLEQRKLQNALVMVYYLRKLLSEWFYIPDLVSGLKANKKNNMQRFQRRQHQRTITLT